MSERSRAHVLYAGTPLTDGTLSTRIPANRARLSQPDWPGSGDAAGSVQAVRRSRPGSAAGVRSSLGSTGGLRGIDHGARTAGPTATRWLDRPFCSRLRLVPHDPSGWWHGVKSTR